MERTKRAFYVKLAAAGFLLPTPANVILGAALAILGQTTPRGLIVPLSVLILFNLLVGVLVLRFIRALTAAVVLSVPLTLGGFAVSGMGLGHPESVFDFLTAVVMVVGPLTGGVASAIARVKRRQGTLRPASTTERWVARGALVALALVAVGSAAVTVSARSSIDAPRGATPIEMEVDEFAPSAIEASSGDAVEVYLVNRDAYGHTFTIDDLDIDEYVGPRASRLVSVRIPAEATGAIEFICYVTGHAGMAGTIDVR